MKRRVPSRGPSKPVLWTPESKDTYSMTECTTAVPATPIQFMCLPRVRSSEGLYPKERLLIQDTRLFGATPTVDPRPPPSPLFSSLMSSGPPHSRGGAPLRPSDLVRGTVVTTALPSPGLPLPAAVDAYGGGGRCLVRGRNGGRDTTAGSGGVGDSNVSEAVVANTTAVTAEGWGRWPAERGGGQ